MRGFMASLGRRIRSLSPREWLEKAWLGRHARSGRTLVVFEADWFGLYPFVRPLVLRLASRSSTTVVVVTRASEVAPIRGLFRRDTQGARRSSAVVSFESLAAVEMKPALVISCQPFSRIAERWQDIPKVQLLHGMADKRGELFGPRKLRDFTHLFSPAPVVTELARERLLVEDSVKHDRIEIVEVGCPKTDDLFDETFDRDEVLRSLRLPADRPTVLYAPTWEREASLEQHGEEIVSSLSALSINLLVKPHPLSLADRKDPFLIENGHGGKDWGRVLETWERRYRDLRWVRESSVNPYLVTADLLLSEGSGVAFEYVLLDKPVVFVDTPLVSERHGVNNLHHRLRSCGVVLPSLEDLPGIVKAQLEDPGETAGVRTSFIGQLAYNPGRAAEVAMRSIEALLSSTP